MPISPTRSTCWAWCVYQTGRLEEAEQHLRRACELRPKAAAFLNHLGVVLGDRGAHDDAVATLRRALGHAPDDADILRNLGVSLQDAGALAKAEVIFQRYAGARPDSAEPWLALGRLQRRQGRHAEARNAFAEAVSRAPDAPDAHWELALAHLSTGALGDGWDEYEWRWRHERFAGSRRDFPRPAWDGGPPDDAGLLIWGEQGIGDTIRYASVVPEVAVAARHCVVECEPRLVPLFARSFLAASVVPATEPAQPAVLDPALDFQVPIGSLARYHRRDGDAFPRHSGYLAADPAQTSALDARYRAADGALVVGVAWRSGNPTSCAARSIPLALWHEILAVPGCRFISLQYGDVAAELDADAVARERLTVDREIDPLVDIDAQAAQIAALDLVITIGNATAQLAGALGRECWTLLPFVADP